MNECAGEIPADCGQTIFKFLDVPNMILNFTSDGVFLSSESQRLSFKLRSIVTIITKFAGKKVRVSRVVVSKDNKGF